MSKNKVNIKNISNKSPKGNVPAQNPDTGLPSFRDRDTQLYEQKNLPDGFHKSSSTTK